MRLKRSMDKIEHGVVYKLPPNPNVFGAPCEVIFLFKEDVDQFLRMNEIGANVVLIYIWYAFI